MRKPTLLYIPLTILFALTVAVLVIHSSHLVGFVRFHANENKLPSIINNKISSVQPDAEVAGLRVGDTVVAINGVPLTDDETFIKTLPELRADEPITFGIERAGENGQIESKTISALLQRRDRDFGFYSRLVTGFLFAYAFPTLSMLLGFWVVFVRPRDFLAWLLLFLLLGISSVSLEIYPKSTFVGFYRYMFFSAWALSMFLFGVYFPERWTVDRRLPWLKWIFIVPLGFQMLLALLEELEIFTGLNVIESIKFVAESYDKIAMPLNLTAIAVFFAALGHKSGTLVNADSRRRLRLIVIGTSVAMTPTFLIVVYRVVTGAKGSFFDIVPFWMAITALFLMMLFPLTLAYVIVVERAMDVGVVVRQGLQYALAKNGVLAAQILLTLAVVFTALSFASDATTNRPQKIIFIAVGVIFVFLIRILADKIKGWTDRKFFREAYDSEQILSDLSEQVRTMVETKPLLETVSNKISQSLHVPQVALLLKNGAAFQPAYALGYDGAPVVSLTESDRTIEKLKTNEPLVVYQDDADSWVNAEAGEAERENLHRLNSQLLLPFGAKNSLSGVISLSPKLSESPYTPTDLRLLKSVAAQTGLALENSRLTEAIVSETTQRERLNREVEIAREVQERLFPQDLPEISGLDYYGACRPALAVGGDYYDFLELPENKFGIAVGDVSGKGIGASLMMASLQASLRGQAIHFQDDLAEMMSRVNKLVYEASTTNRYATFFYAQLDLQTKKMIYVNAGHNPPFVVRRKANDFEVLRLEEGGAVVGMLPPMLVSYKQGEIDLQPGDLLVGYTDGISEAMNPAEEEWSEDEMLAAIKEKFDLPADEMLAYLIERADRFAAGAKQHDDMTAIIVRVN